MIQINLMGNKGHFEKFCDEMNGELICRSPHCNKTCLAAAIIQIQKWCNEGMTLKAAVKKWVTTGLTHRDGEEILADLMGVKDLDEVREILSEDKNVENK
jgi:hypothetical protein